MEQIIKPRLTLPSKPVADTNVQTMAELALPVALPVHTWRARISLIMLLLSLWLITTTAMFVLCACFSVPGIYRFVGVVVTLLIGCALSGLAVFSRSRFRVQLTRPDSDTLSDLKDKVSMDTTSYLRAVRADD